MSIEALIVVRLQVEWLHQWEQCPLEEVSFLKTLHRHIFHIECKKKVTHNDRDIEIIMYKRKIQEFIENKFYEVKEDTQVFGNMSCEMIAELLIKEFDLYSCQVLEDNENGALLYNI